MDWVKLLIIVWIFCSALISSNTLEKSPENYVSCTKNADCAPNNCCSFEAEATLSTSTQILWRCKPLGDVDEICHSLGSVHCPCKAGLRCEPKAVWFFGAGLCKQK